MTHTLKLARRTARFRATVFAAAMLSVAACNSADTFTPDNSTDPEVTSRGVPTDPEPDAPAGDEDAADALPIDGTAPMLATSFAGGIPMGLFNIPWDEMGPLFNGVVRCIYPDALLKILAAVKSRGGKVIINMGCSASNYKDASGNFSLSKWKARIDLYRKIDLSSYVQDGTIIGSYLIDEPHDKNNWNGHLVAPSTLEEMARYSKQYWPTMPTIVRSWPDYLDNYSGEYKYLDAGWAQYSYRKGDPSNFINYNVSRAKAKGLALIVGLNVKGGPNGSYMTASQVKNWGSILLSSSYPCAFLSWRYYDWYLTSTMKSSFAYLRDKAENRSSKSCRGS